LAVRIRLTRVGRKKRPYYRIIAVDSRKRRDGAYLDNIGFYHPLDDPPTVKIDADKALKWLRVGAEPSETVLSLLRGEGVWLRFRLEKRGMPETQIQEKMAEWFATHAKPKEQPEPGKATAPVAPAPTEAETVQSVEAAPTAVETAVVIEAVEVAEVKTDTVSEAEIKASEENVEAKTDKVPKKRKKTDQIEASETETENIT
jgi:small subunit ribosomal protein S16